MMLVLMQLLILQGDKKKETLKKDKNNDTAIENF